VGDVMAESGNIVVVVPGDHVLICLSNEYVTEEMTQYLREQVKPRFPDVEFTFIGGVTAMAVHRGDHLGRIEP